MNSRQIESMMYDVLKKYAPKADYLEIRAETTRSLQFLMSNDELSRLDVPEDQGFSIRACIRGGWGFVSLNSPERLSEYADLAIEGARSLARDRTYLASVEPVRDQVPLDLKLDPRTVSLSDKLDLFRGMIDTGRSVSGEIDNVSGSYFEEFRSIRLMTSEGTDVSMEKLDLGAGVVTQAHRNGVTQSQAVTAGSNNDYEVIRGMAARVQPAARRTLELLAAPRVKAGRYTVVVDPVLGGTFVHEAFGHMSEADDYHMNPRMREIFTLGRRFGSEGLGIYDTGLDPGTRGSVRYDDEGVPGEKTWLIREGILVGRLHNRESAARFGETPTGNARCLNYRFPPICRMRNTCIAQGTAAFDDLIGDIKLGVYAVDTQGGTGGEMFSFDAGYGIMIRNGRLAEMVREVQLSGNLFTTMKNIDAIGNDFTICDDQGGCGKGPQFPLETTVSSPHVRIRNVTVGGV